jgi:signal transduction histidine kinase
VRRLILLLQVGLLKALNNVVKHAGAQHVDIALERSDREFAMRLSDDAVGFDGSATSKIASDS